ncbi:DUF3226 domain-containing protein [Roseinatronobacter monicus]|uniref:DUF3226 domain-containing protein n=1 Tax=Roseinatronobacter monicus TaxID=393481 RepID=A0A543KBK5_9RHOB|nr:DUF3226 domain-containing protein [Roseinatronobacter monicus]TQM92450.1 hypothetical protein BD293_1057 [Roseinatronobacter monicus]
MRNFIFATEGAHDVSFLGKLLVRRGFEKTTIFDKLPAEWKPLFPKKFPWNGNSIERVARFPEVFQKDDLVVGLLNSGGDSRLISVVRNTLDILIPGNVERVVIFSDADCEPASKRFDNLTAALKNINDLAAVEKAPGYPIPVPSKIGILECGNPEVAIFVFPDNFNSGTLEDILFECSSISHPDLSKMTSDFVASLDSELAGGHKSLIKMRQGSNNKKCIMGSIANVLKPGSSLAVAVEQQKLIPEIKESPQIVMDVDNFVKKCLL